MALAPLATAADLSARGISVSDQEAAVALLGAASEAVRDAAGCTITSAEATVNIEGGTGRWLAVPGWAVTAVSDVSIDDVTVTDYKFISGRLFRAYGWAGCEPSIVTLTFTQGLADAPADIVDLVCSLVGAGLAAKEDGYAANIGKAYESIDDYRVGYSVGDDAVASVMELPERTRSWLASRFNSGVAVTGIAQ